MACRRSSVTLAQYATARLLKVAASTWVRA